MKYIFLVVTLMLGSVFLGIANDLSGKWKLVDVGLNDSNTMLLSVFANKQELYFDFSGSKCVITDQKNTIIEEQTFKVNDEELLFTSNGNETSTKIEPLENGNFKILFDDGNWYQLAKVKK